MRVLKIDKLVPPEMAINFEGVEYEIVEPDVGTFLRLTSEETRMAAKDQRGSVVEAVELIKRVIPSMPESVLLKMKFSELFAVIAFINGQIDEIGNPAGAAAALAEAEGVDPEKQSE